MDLWLRKTGPEKPFGWSMHRLSPRTLSFCVIIVPFLAIGGWLLLKYAPLPIEKPKPDKPMLQSKETTATNVAAGIGSASEKTDLNLKAKNPPMPRIIPLKEKAPARKPVAASRMGAGVPEKKKGNLPAVVNRTQAKTQLKQPARVDPRLFQTAVDPNNLSGSPSSRDGLVPNKEGNVYPPPCGSYPPRTVEKPPVDERSVLAGFFIQAIAWSKLPAERIAVINGVVVREGGFVEGLQVSQIGMDEVSLKKGDKTWLLQFGR